MMSNSIPKISIVITAYNISDYIGECLESILYQSFRDLEIICVDDGSTDGIFEILQQYKAKDSRIQVIHFEQNQGLSRARNAGMDAASGDYLLFIDGDDYHRNGSLQQLYEIIRENDLDLLLFDWETVYCSGNPNLLNLHPEPRKKSTDRIMSGAALLELQLAEKEYLPSVGLQIVRTELLKESGIRFFSGILHEDELYTPLIMEKSSRAMCIGDKLYMRRVRSNSIMTSPISYKNVDGYFVVSTELMARYIADRCQNKGMGMRAKSMRGASLDRYRMLSKEEKAKSGKELPEIYQFLFERSNFKLDDEKKQNSLLKQEIEELKRTNSLHQQEIRRLTENCRKLADANADYHHEADRLNSMCEEVSRLYSDICHSYSYRAGRVISYIPRKLRDLWKWLLKNS